MSEPFIEPFVERLSRFSPDGTGLDRDALLFAAGRASAHPSRGWRALAGAMVAAQFLTLALLWPRPVTPVADPLGESTAMPVAETPLPPAAATVLALRSRAVQTEGDLPVSDVIEPMASSGPPLHAFAAARAMLD